MALKYRIYDEQGNVFFCNLKDKYIDILSKVDQKSKVIKNIRAGKYKCNGGHVFAFSDSPDYVNSSKKFVNSFNVIIDSVLDIEQMIADAKSEHNKKTSRLIHNLTSLNAHNIQEVYSLIPQDVISSKTRNRISVIEGIVREDTKDVALSLLRIAKNNAAMKAEFSVFKKLFDGNPELRSTYHEVHKVLMNIFYLFFPDFTDKDVKVEVKDSKETAFFDYESIHVAFYHLIENATKYVLPKTKLEVSIDNIGEFVTVTMDMRSTEIKRNELDKIFEEGHSGELSCKTAKAGKGIGMSVARKILLINRGDLLVQPDYKSKMLVLGVAYQQNKFIVKLPKKHH